MFVLGERGEQGYVAPAIGAKLRNERKCIKLSRLLECFETFDSIGKFLKIGLSDL